VVVYGSALQQQRSGFFPFLFQFFFPLFFGGLLASVSIFFFFFFSLSRAHARARIIGNSLPLCPFYSVNLNLLALIR